MFTIRRTSVSPLRRPRPFGKLGWLAALGVVTVFMLVLRTHIALNEAHVALVYLLVVLGGSAYGGRLLGFTLSGTAFLLFDWFFLPPYGTLVILNPLDWLVLLAFLVTSLVATHLLARAREQAEAAETLGLERERLARDAEHAEALRAADRLKDALLASVSHDLRTPLTTIKALANAIAVSGDDRAVTIEEEADRLNGFVENLLDLSRIQAGARPRAPVPNEAEDLVGAALQRVSGRATGREIHAKFMADHDALLIGQFDFTDTLRALVNLLENALKYAPVNQPIDLTVSREGPWLVFEVADRGPGIAAGEETRIFEPFYRKTGVRPDSGSTGLGLSIARSLAATQQGSLTYTPRSGGGSTFSLRLPALDITTLAPISPGTP